MSISVIIPVLHEEERINQAIAHVRAVSPPETEIIVVDGDPTCSTLAAVSDRSVTGISSQKGRGRQLNRGAAASSGELLLFLHADTELPANALSGIVSVMRDKKTAAGAFDLGIDSEKFVFRVIERLSSLRSRLTRIPYGDQAVFIRRSVFDEIGGFRDFTIMEDVELMRDLKRKGYRLAFIPDRVRTSPRRWEREGILRCTIRNWLLISLYLLGASPERLSRFYRSV